jgi:hypothetical protein
VAGSRAGRTGGANRSKVGRASWRRRAEQVDGAGQSRAVASGMAVAGTREAVMVAASTKEVGIA